ncbi:MAG: hypothetical protein RBT45_06820 [Acholeplasmataceae bacterium]|nr:hypothetical protein [Acholeplasmataceae bacterium]
MIEINTNFNMYHDAKGKDPDTYSYTLHSYHHFLWNKLLPNGNRFKLDSIGDYKYHLLYSDDKFNLKLSSDSIIHPYHYFKTMQHIITKINPKDIENFHHVGATIGGYIIFPSEKIDNKATINTVRGFHPMIKDRFDFTLECIRRYYIGQNSPLYEHLSRYKNFFDLFIDFKGYVDFFLLNDLVDEDYNIEFWLPFIDFERTKALPKDINEYNLYMNHVIEFVKLRNKRILSWVKSQQK